MAIRGVVAEDSIILALILDSIIFNPLEMPLPLLNFLVFNHSISPRVVLVFLQFILKVNLRIQDLIVKFVARMVTLPWIAIIK